MVSRESSFLFNNVILLASCFAVLWGTLFPVISEAVSGEKITVGAPFFNKVNVPIGLVLLFLTGVGPLFAWRRTSVDSLKRNFLWPAVASLALGVVLVALGMRHFYATGVLRALPVRGDHDPRRVLPRRPRDPGQAGPVAAAWR